MKLTKEPLNAPQNTQNIENKKSISPKKCVGNALRDSVATGIRAISDSALDIRSLSLYLFDSFSLVSGLTLTVDLKMNSTRWRSLYIKQITTVVVKLAENLRIY